MEHIAVNDESRTFEVQTAEYMARAKHWDYILQNGQTTPEGWQHIFQTVQQELGDCPYRGTHLFVKGTGLIPDISALIAEEDSFEILGETEGMTGMHEGIIVMSETDGDGNSHYRLRHRLHVATGAKQVSIFQEASQDFYAYFDMDSEMVPTKTIRSINARNNSDFPVEEKQSLLMDMDVYSQKLVNEVRSTRFRRLTRDKQAQFLAARVGEINDALQIMNLGIKAMAEYIVAPALSGNSLYLAPIQVDPELLLQGECLGVGSLDELLVKNKAVRRNSDMFSKFVGLSILVDPSPDTREELRLADQQLLYIPFGDQEVSLEFT